MFAKMVQIMYTTSFMWFWMLVFPASVGMQGNSAIGKKLLITIIKKSLYN